MRVRIHKQIEISASHIIPNHPGKCKNLHGHNYKVELWAEGEINPATGMVVDFGEMSRDLWHEVGAYDHTHLNDQVYFIPTAENLTIWWLKNLYQINPAYIKIRVWETEDSYAEADASSLGDFWANFPG